MASTRVIKLPRSDDESMSVLVQVTSAGRMPLDLKLVATEGDAPYVCILRHDRVASLRVKNCPVSEEEWEHVLEALVRQEPMDDILATATVQSESSISLVVRKQVQGITQRLGAISFNCDQDEQIELFRWCEISLDALAKNKAEAVSSAARVRELESAVADLEKQLDQLVTAKQQDETALLYKFRDLLNEKKVKIREQQKIIAAASFGGSQPASSRTTQAADVRTARQPTQSRPSKRKAERESDGQNKSDSDGQGLENGSVKGEADESGPGDTSDGTASTAGDDGLESAGEEATERGDKALPAQKTESQKRPPGKAAEEPPAPRNLPFAKSQAPAPGPAEEETESDDEL